MRVPIASKKFANTNVNTNMTAASTPIRPKLDRLKSPTSERSGSANGDPDSVGTDRLQPPGRSTARPRCQIASMTTATTVPETSPMRIPPRTFRTTRTPVTSSVNTKTSVGTVLIVPTPPVPSPTGGEGSPVELMNPASTSPMKRMNRPMPAVIASLSCMGTASNTSLRSPVAARTTMMSPLMTTSPMASGQVSDPTTVVARNELMPRPAANANGSRAKTPKRIVITPAASDVVADTCAKSSLLPSTSAALDRMIGLSTMMYAIAMKVTRPPRSSAPTVDWRSEISKKRSRRSIRRP